MINLLTQEEKKKIRKEYLFRLSLVALVLLLGSSLIGIALLIPPFLISSIKERDVRGQSELLKQSIENSSRDSSIVQLREAAQKLEALAEAKDQIKIADMFKRVADHRTEGIELAGLFYKQVSDNEAILTVSGVANNRGDLLAFSRALEQDLLFSGVELPVSNLAKEENISFSFKITSVF